VRVVPRWRDAQAVRDMIEARMKAERARVTLSGPILRGPARHAAALAGLPEGRPHRDAAGKQPRRRAVTNGA
jgi:hypothetical protein